MKILSIVISILMVFSLFATFVKAEDSTENVDISKYVIKAREIFGVSMDYDEVNSNVGDHSISINWNMKNDYSMSERITFDFNGNVLNYNKNFDDYKRFNRTLVSREDAKKMADALVKKLYPKSELKFENLEVADSNYNLTYRLYSNGVRVYGAVVQISLNKEDGNCYRVDSTDSMQMFLRYDAKVDVSGIKGEGEAFEAIKKAYPSRLDLLKSIDEKYVPYYTWNKRLIVDAKDFSKVKYDYWRSEYGANTKDASDEAAEKSMSEVEIKEKDKIKNLKTKEEALEKAISFFNLDKKKLKSGNLYPIYGTDFYNYSFNFRNDNKGRNYYFASATVKADDLLPTQFYTSDGRNDERKADASKVAPWVDKIKNELPFFDEYKEILDDDEDDNDPGYYIRKHFMRKLGEYFVPDDSIYLTFGADGLTNYGLTRIWGDIEHEDKKISSDDAFERLKKSFGCRLYILPIIDENRENIKETRLVYAIDTGMRSQKVRATDGKIGSDDEKYLNSPKGEEDDAEVKDAVISGFGVVDNKAYDDTATYKDLLYNLSYLFYENMNENTDMMMNSFKDLKIFDKDTLDSPVTRETLAKALVLKKLSLTPEDIRTDVFNEDIKAKEKAYPALMIMLSGDFKDMNFEENATVHDMLKMISSIIFR
ncbi:YcdB/YcdC domain-containing protein [Ezakiella coagulans]|uniref:YcdB/YcdC domain-containing protein n=1 Tax=Ezakiella coagulans TaxID=46507 RepID=UPI00288C1F6B|nr:YcdB/YcdC domain-containing protein [Ezakiella coagulans]